MRTICSFERIALLCFIPLYGSLVNAPPLVVSHRRFYVVGRCQARAAERTQSTPGCFFSSVTLPRLHWYKKGPWHCSYS